MAATQLAVAGDRNVDDNSVIPSEPAATATANATTITNTTNTTLSSRATPSTPAPAPDATNAESYEAQHVHQVYNTIAPHFSATRHKPWPLVAAYLASRPPGSLGLDVGCGNGKYLSCVPGTCFALASDRSDQLVGLAARSAGQQKQQNNQALVADGLALPFRDARADFAICIAVVHHMSTRARRVAAVAEILRCLTPPGPSFDDADLGAESGRAGGGGTVMIFVWALEQSSSRRGWGEGGEQDLLVPWVMKGDQGREKKKGIQKRPAAVDGQEGQKIGQDVEKSSPQAVGKPDQTFQRYYHLYREGELEEDIIAAQGRVLSSGYDRDNWWAVASRAAPS
ncbi:hypothetical protein MCOR25_005199 [Pyricularia grisea]|uniref:Methyltransferase type 11 domain-containing protein n=1 Tax=Pyricularia grisea TaxID=148305 RepID=A0A6P8BHI1_PYRGI|nr:uncharacterized protein PgNI_00207 [Pyricularia grisea]KAI6365964.1 hypothetical protein MCOR25_005199 [Pyricularia grisea]TLD16107.1 hypothetical protein PgNI_00207 [Pyricularia grisea]